MYLYIYIYIYIHIYIYVSKNINDKIAMIAMSVSDYTALKKFYFFACKFYIIWMDIQRVSNSFFLI